MRLLSVFQMKNVENFRKHLLYDDRHRQLTAMIFKNLSPIKSAKFKQIRGGIHSLLITFQKLRRAKYCDVKLGNYILVASFEASHHATLFKCLHNLCESLQIEYFPSQNEYLEMKAKPKPNESQRSVSFYFIRCYVLCIRKRVHMKC